MVKRSFRSILLVAALVATLSVVGAFRGGTAHAQTGISCIQNPFTGVVTCFQIGTNPVAPSVPQGCIVDQFGNVLCAPFASPLGQQSIVLVPQQGFVGQPIFLTSQPFLPFGLPPNCVMTIFGTVACF